MKLLLGDMQRSPHGKLTVLRDTDGEALAVCAGDRVGELIYLALIFYSQNRIHVFVSFLFGSDRCIVPFPGDAGQAGKNYDKVMHEKITDRGLMIWEIWKIKRI